MALNAQDTEATGYEVNVAAGSSELACESCRRRKAKCDRTLPCCIFCTKTSQTCTYPSRRLKPGPKLGNITWTSVEQHMLTASIGSSQRRQNRVRFNGSREGQGRDSRSSVDGDFDPDAQYPMFRPGRGKSDALPCKSSASSSSGAILHLESPLPLSPQVAELDDTLDASDSSDSTASNFVRAISLSSLIHPTHESCLMPPTSVSDMSTSGFFVNLAGAQDLIMQACQSLDLSINTLQALTDLYFKNMTSFSLFHQPSFGIKIQEIKNLLHLKTLFAAMFSFSARFEVSQSQQTCHTPNNYADKLSHERFHTLALRFIEEALDKCVDEIPPFCLLQALTLSTFYQLTNGVRGRAWRLLGSCVRVAYELRLHLVDYEGRVDSHKVGADLARWSADEERRRCWWAIWEMDTFASTIRRYPSAIDWTMIDTYLPVKDEFWFNNQYQASCFFERKPMDRSEKLKKSGNESPVAWFIVINSIMRNAQVLSQGNLEGVLPESDPDNNVARLTHYFRNTFRKKRLEEDSTQLTTLVHALRFATSVLPDCLTYKGENLRFSSCEPCPSSRPEEDGRCTHSAKYNIYLMMQLARFMIYHHYAFGEIVAGTIFAEKPTSRDFGWTVAEQESPTSCDGLRNCLEAADNILAITNRCADNYVQYVNPFLASTVWLATAIQILRKVFALDAQAELAESKCQILRLSCHQYTQFWQTPLALLKNLDTLEERLIMRRNLSAALGNEALKPIMEHERKASVTSWASETKRQSSRDRSVESTGVPRPLPSSPTCLDLEGITSSQSPLVSSSRVTKSMTGFDGGAAGGHAALGKSPVAGMLGASETTDGKNGTQVAKNAAVLVGPSTLEPSTHLALDGMDTQQGFSNDFTWYVSTLMSGSLSR